MNGFRGCCVTSFIVALSLPLALPCYATDSINVFVEAFEELKQPAEFHSADGMLKVGHLLEETWHLLGDGTSDVESEFMFIRGPTYNATIPGPTLRVKAGDTLIVRTENNLPANTDDLITLFGVDLEFCTPLQKQKIENGDLAALIEAASLDYDYNFPHQINTYNLHTHGLHVSPAYKADQVLQGIAPGEAFTNIISIPEDHAPGLYFYHSHNHGAIWAQYRSGLAGTIIVEGAIDEIPEIAAAKDVLLFYQQIEADQYFTTNDPDTEATQIGQIFPTCKVGRTINGQINPIIRIQPGEVQRWRIVNASRDDQLPIECDGVDFYVIAYDGIPIDEPVLMEQLYMASANRIEVLAKAREAGTYSLTKLAAGPVAEQTIATVIVEGEKLNMGIPNELIELSPIYDPIEADEVTGYRDLLYSVSVNPGSLPDFLINGKLFDPTRVDQSLTLNEVDEWVLTGAGHPHHVHTNDMYMVDIEGTYLDGRNARDLYPTLPLWLDTVMIPTNGSVTLRSRYKKYTGAFVLHCHLIQHEDLGMMQLVEILPPMGSYYLGVSQYDDSGDDYSFQWFGDFNVSQLPWIYHYQLGWMYPGGTGAEDDDFWLYGASLDLEWLWTNSVTFPILWSDEKASWLYYLEGINTNYFYDLNENEWFEVAIN
ncbi:multicopper oxidase domain-containing protein [Rubellicoccus peritrichatus]|uniref:Multicopper oxidase domain-containing protein n=1 Tax=Rubellicoccus peritrichatus TaxID=3080537 RepID=A0AAQ3LBB5_9BACT|nr:multicopper oxidase domain-containing protein [Puniceicoccus sp. CR14]WOO40780.1 multicopper oxidase domain-containing protein [Puniceicoccus sp. CR14]